MMALRTGGLQRTMPSLTRNRTKAFANSSCAIMMSKEARRRRLPELKIVRFLQEPLTVYDAGLDGLEENACGGLFRLRRSHTYCCSLARGSQAAHSGTRGSSSASFAPNFASFFFINIVKFSTFASSKWTAFYKDNVVSFFPTHTIRFSLNFFVIYKKTFVVTCGLYFIGLCCKSL
jgi:hypothetical protein